MYNLNVDEQAMLDSYESGEWTSVPKLLREVQRYRAYAAAETVKRVQISLSQEDLEGIQQKARQAGIPYQEFIALIVHKFVAGQ